MRRPWPCFLLTVVSPISGTWEVPSKHLLTVRRNCLESWFSSALPALWHVILAIVSHPISPKLKFFPSPVWLVWKIAYFKDGHHSIYPISHAFLQNSCWFSSLWGMCLFSILLNLAWPVTMMGLYSDTVWLLRLGNKRWDIEFAHSLGSLPLRTQPSSCVDIQAMWRDDV